MSSATYRQPALLPAASLEPIPVTDFAEVAGLISDLDELCAEGMLEAFRDQNNIVRYRPIRKAA